MFIVIKFVERKRQEDNCMNRNKSSNAKNKKESFGKAALKRLDRLHKKNQELFKEDKIIIKELRRIINEQQRKAS